MKCPEELLALSAAGVLDASEERVVREHVRECAACAAILEELADVASGLGRLPAPMPPAYLASTVASQMAEYADRRQAARLAVGAAVLAWVIGVSGWYALELVSNSAAMVWTAWSIGSALVATPVMAGLLRRYRRTA